MGTLPRPAEPEERLFVFTFRLEILTVMSEGDEDFPPRVDFHPRICDSVSEVSGARKGRAGGVRASLTGLFKLQHFERVDAVSVSLARFYSETDCSLEKMRLNKKLRKCRDLQGFIGGSGWT